MLLDNGSFLWSKGVCGVVEINYRGNILKV